LLPGRDGRLSGEGRAGAEDWQFLQHKPGIAVFLNRFHQVWKGGLAVAAAIVEKFNDRDIARRVAGDMAVAVIEKLIAKLRKQRLALGCSQILLLLAVGDQDR